MLPAAWDHGGFMQGCRDEGNWWLNSEAAGLLFVQSYDKSLLWHSGATLCGSRRPPGCCFCDISAARQVECSIPAWMQVEALRWRCLQGLVQGISTQTVLEYAQLADTLSDTTLMNACILFFTESDQGYVVMLCSAMCCQDRVPSRWCLLHRVEVAEQHAMKSLMNNKPDLAQKLLVAVMKHTASSKRKADEISIA